MRFAVFALIAATAFAQAPGLVKETGSGPDGQPVILLRNTSTLGVTAWAWESRSTLDRDHFGPGRTQWAGSDGAYTATVAIAPAASISTGIRPDEPVTLDSAVIYTDGSTAGDPKLVERMLATRRAALAEIPAFRREIESALASHQPIQSLREKMNTRKFTVPAGGMFAQGPSAVAFKISRLLKDSTRLEETAPRILEELARMQANLEASNPALR